MSFSRTTQSQDNSRAARLQADARGVPASIMLPRVFFIVCALALTAYGFVMVFSASRMDTLINGEPSTAFMMKQIIFSGVGIAGAFFLARIVPYEKWNGPAGWVIYAVAMFLILLVSLIGDSALGATRWVTIAGFTLQPSEFAKIAFIMIFALVFSRFLDGECDFRYLLTRTLIFIIIPVGFLFATQSDLGTVLVVLVGLFGILWLANVPAKFFGVFFGGLGILCALALVIAPYRMTRIQVWLDPWSDPLGDGFQAVRSFYAFAEGGLFGTGLGTSNEKFYLPMAHNDFIFSVIGEETGFVGAFLVIVLFIALLICGLKISETAPTTYGRLLAGGLITMIVGQAFLNMACTIGMFPITGKPLPFISAGGSSLLSSFLILGLILAVSVGSNTLNKYEKRRNNLNVLTTENGGSEAYDYRPRRTNTARRPQSSRYDDGRYDDYRTSHGYDNGRYDDYRTSRGYDDGYYDIPRSTRRRGPRDLTLADATSRSRRNAASFEDDYNHMPSSRNRGSDFYSSSYDRNSKDSSRRTRR